LINPATDTILKLANATQVSATPCWVKRQCSIYDVEASAALPGEKVSHTKNKEFHLPLLDGFHNKKIS